MKKKNVPAARAWARLRAHAKSMSRVHVRDLYTKDPDRFSSFSRVACGLLGDFSRQRMTQQTLDLLCELAEAAGLGRAIDDLFAGKHVNSTEDRPALHVALRAPTKKPRIVDRVDVAKLVRAERTRLEEFTAAVHSGTRTGASGRSFTDVVNIGIGGSDLGPVMATEALRSYGRHCRAHFVSNIDGCQLADLVQKLDAARTLFIICSKTFTTLETLTNARAARAWIVAQLGENAVPRHFAAVSVNAKAMDAFGIPTDARFAMWDWVGGRYSVWSAIGLSVELVIGSEQFREFLAGGHDMDEHFRTAPFERNLPALLGLIGVWNIDALGLASHAILPYDQRLHRFAAYLQQLEMESNGKRVGRDGKTVKHATGTVIWGEPGSNAQHSFFQLLHQGTITVPMDFLAPVKSSCDRQDQQDLAIANCLAQAQAFALGYDGNKIPPEKKHPGNRPSTLILFDRLDPRTLGKLVALYEHKVYAQSVVWGINPFDQWGVEL
ncbi:MAG: glucose-6-phosphate isomerase, partial [Steroidobacteraceae bacterium]